MSPPIPRASRSLDVLVWGATGYTGRLVAEYLARGVKSGRPALAGLRWAIGGRSREKLERIRADLCTIDPSLRDLPILTGDARDPASLDSIARDVRAIATTVGPFAIHGRELVRACVDAGTDYCDLTGEVQFVRAMIDAHHARARQTGARIVHCCGYDSIPSDLGALMVQEHMLEQHGARCTLVKHFAGEMKGGTSGGTIASAINLVEEATRDPAIRRLLLDPYSLDPDRPSRGPDGLDQQGVAYDPDLRRFTGPFIMAGINARIVRRSNAMLGYAWGLDFSYREAMSFMPGPRGLVAATAVAAGTAALFGALAIPPIRKFLQNNVLPAPGEGPPASTHETGYFVSRFVGKGGPGKPTLLGTIKGTSDPGYGETAKMLSESAVCLARDESIPTTGGVLTPASAMGMPLIRRLRDAGMTFEVREV